MQTKTVAIVMAAGRGSRMAPFTDSTPKPLAKIKEKTLLEINLENLEPLVDEFVIVIGWLGEQIKEVFGSEFRNKKITYARQSNPKGGTLDAFRTGLYSQVKFKNYNYIVTNADNILDRLVYKKLSKAIDQNPNKAYLLAKKIKDKEILKSQGVFRVKDNFEFIEIIEKPQKFISDLTNVGCYYLPKNISQLVSNKQNLDNQEEYITDLFNQFSKKNEVVVISYEGLYLPISSIIDLKKANQNKEIDH